MSGSSVARRRTTPFAAAVAVAVILLGAVPSAGALAAAPDEQPSIAYLEAMAHEHDRIAFEPGGRVTVPFTPRASDHWPVDGQPPRALPAGRATGSQMAATPNGTAWADLRPVDNPVDAPSGEGALAASWAAWAPAALEPAPDTAAASGLRRQVFGYLPHWELEDAAATLNYDVLSTIAYYSVGANRKGDLRKRDSDGRLTSGWAGWTSAAMTRVIDRAHEHGTRVVLSVSAFAWTAGVADAQRSLLGSRAHRENLARQAAAAVRDRGADGINLDFEPIASGYKAEFVELIRAVRAALNRLGPGYELTYATTGYIGNYPVETGVGRGLADAIFVMGYGYRSQASFRAGSIDPLHGRRYDLTDTVREYTSRVSPSRIILGLPWFGRAWPTVSDEVRADTLIGARYEPSTDLEYQELADLIERHGRRWDSVELSPYVAYRHEYCTAAHGCLTTWRQVYYDDRESLTARLAMVNEHGLRGAGIWALGYDDGEPGLYRAFAESFLVDKAAPEAGIVALDADQRDEGFVVRWAARDTSHVVAYDVQVSVDGGPWTSWVAGTTATSDVYLGHDDTGYAFRARARDSQGNTGPWNVVSTWTAAPALGVGGFARVVTDELAYRSGTGSRSIRLGRLDAGTLVAITGGPVIKPDATWYEVTQPILEWGPVSFVERGVWIQAGTSTETNIVPAPAPNTTFVDAALVGLGVEVIDAGDPSSRLLTPDGDGVGDSVRLRWTNAVALDGLEVRVLRRDGSRVATATLPTVGVGDQAWDWDGRVDGQPVPDGSYLLQLVGTAGGRSVSAPSSRPTTPAQLDRYGVTVDLAAPVVVATATPRRFSPNGDHHADRTRLAVTSNEPGTGWVRIYRGDTRIRAWAVGVSSAWSTRWDGTRADGRRVPDGRYTLRVRLTDVAGHTATASTSVVVDR